MIKPVLEPEFKPAIIELRNFFKDVQKEENKQHYINGKNMGAESAPMKLDKSIKTVDTIHEDL